MMVLLSEVARCTTPLGQLQVGEASHEGRAQNLLVRPTQKALVDPNDPKSLERTDYCRIVETATGWMENSRTTWCAGQRKEGLFMCCTAS